jgi:glycosyltransferase involved in cell wall biosynthesis
LEVLTVSRLHRPMRPVGDTLALVALVRLFLRERPTIVHTHSSKAGQLGRLAARIAGVPVVMHTVHGWSFHDGMRPALRAAAVLVERLTARLTSSLIVVADRDRRTGVQRRIGRPDQYTLVRSAIELADYRPRPDAAAGARQAIGLDAAAPVVGTVTRFLPQKDPITLARAFAQVAERVPGSRLVVVGDGPMRARVEELLGGFGIRDRVTLLGARTDVAAILPAFDVFVSSSRWEGLPRVIVEAATAGLPVVATDVGGNSELLVHGESGMLVPAGDADALAAAVTAVLTDGELARSLRRAAMDVVAPFDVSVMARDLEALYLRSVSWASGRHPGDDPAQAAVELELQPGVSDVDLGTVARAGSRRLPAGCEVDAEAVEVPLRSA